RPHAQHKHVECWGSSARCGKLGQLLGVSLRGLIYRDSVNCREYPVDVFLRQQWEVVQESLLCLDLITVFVPCRYVPFIAPPHVDLGPVHGVLEWAGRDLSEGRNTNGSTGQHNVAGGLLALQIKQFSDQTCGRCCGQNLSVWVNYN